MNYSNCDGKEYGDDDNSDNDDDDDDERNVKF